MRVAFYVTGKVVKSYPLGLTSHFLTICWGIACTRGDWGPNMELLRQQQEKMVYIQPTSKNDDVDRSAHAGIAAR